MSCITSEIIHHSYIITSAYSIGHKNQPWLMDSWTHGPVDCSLPDSSVHGIFQARTLASVAISFSRGSSPPGDQTHVSWIGRHSLPLSQQGSSFYGERTEIFSKLKNAIYCGVIGASQVALAVKNPPASATDAKIQVQSLGWEDRLT